MEKILVVSGTNRPGSLTRQFAEVYVQLLKDSGIDADFFHLEKLPEDVFTCDMYAKEKPTSVQRIQDLFTQNDKFIFIFPEYNGSYPGILKLVVDVMDPKIAFQYKKAGLIGISTGRAGNLRGMDQFAAILNHMGVTVMPYLLPVSRVQAELTDGNLSEVTHKVVNLHIQRMINC